MRQVMDAPSQVDAGGEPILALHLTAARCGKLPKTVRTR
jgi:hypothetical protein